MDEEERGTSSAIGSQNQEADMDIDQSSRIGMIILLRCKLILLKNHLISADEPQHDKGKERQMENGNSTVPRPRRASRMPSYFKDMILYNIYS